MREYLLSVVAAAIAVGAVTALIPEGEGGGLRRHVSFVGALCVLAILISPVGELMGFLGDLSFRGFGTVGDGTKSEYEEIYAEYLQYASAENLSDSVAAMLCDRFDIPPEQCRVRVRVGSRDGRAAAEQVTVILSGSALLCDPYEIEGFISDMLGCECVVVG